MCGIAGIWHLDNQPVEQEIIDRFTDIMAHRGPDGRGTWCDDKAGLALGHRRLAIFDLSASGLQPLHSECKRYVLVFNGEIYNFIELRKELENKGRRFITETDSEVLLESYIEWGEDCQLRLNGMWAFAIWDRQEQSLFLSRDRFSIKPLHYSYDGRHFAFASELRPFLCLPFLRGGLDPVGWRLAYERASHSAGSQGTILAGVRQLPGGWSLRIFQDKPSRLVRWWNTLDHLETPPKRFEDQVSRFMELFRQACGLRMRSDTSIATALSGGVDSGSVYTMLANIATEEFNPSHRMQRDWSRAFVAAYRNTSNNEEEMAMRLVGELGGAGSVIPIFPPDNLDEFDRVSSDAEAICWDIPIGPWKVYQAMRRAGIYVSLDGHGGDETLAGYAHLIIPAMHDALFPVPHPLRLWHHWRLLSAINFKGYGFPPLQLRDILWPHNRTYTATLFNEFHKDKTRLRKETLRHWLYEETHYTGLTTNLRDFDRLSMAHGVEVRTPFLDWRLVCYAFSLPGHSKLGKGYTKRILRSAMRGLMPDFIRLERVKHGFGSPMADWKVSCVKNYILDAVNDQTFLECPLFNGFAIREKVNKLARTDPTSVPNLDREIMAARLHLAMQKTVQTLSTSENI